LRFGVTSDFVSFVSFVFFVLSWLRFVIAIAA